MKVNATYRHIVEHHFNLGLIYNMRDIVNKSHYLHKFYQIQIDKLLRINSNFRNPLNIHSCFLL